MSVSNSSYFHSVNWRTRIVAVPTILFSLGLIPTYSMAAGTLQDASEALGVAKIQSIAFTGTGRWYQFGQAPNTKSPWPPFDVSSYDATINYGQPAARVQITRKQVVEAGRVRPAPVEQKPDQYVSGNAAWNLAAAPGAATPTVQPQPAQLEERITEIWTTPQGFLKAAAANNATSQAHNGGTKLTFTAGKNRYVGIINVKNQVERVQTWIDNPVLGDTEIDYTYSNYKDFNGVLFPAHIVRKQGGYPVLDLNIASVTPNAAAHIDVPAEASASNAQSILVTSEELAPGVYYLKGGTHHSVLIDQKDHLVIVEAPLNEARSEAVIAKAKELVPNKPIRYLVNTHHHFDHSGGLRTFVDEGATIVTQQANKPYYEKIWAAKHTINPDRLAKSNKSAKFAAFSDKHVLTDGQRNIEIHTIKDSGHNDAFALIYLPAEKILIEADAYTPLPAGAPVPASINPYSVNLYDNIKRLKLNVDKIAALHGPNVVTLADLEGFIGK
ncbi:MBL fold metallo-hydrolase [Methylobacillus caricis]|uniref:MBL fold metallo-hydrolase n=1 Tax=Methylobacillus caricis TaxID=1971611 RepID=UPI001CFF771D|nr:MBL fold metallo-hydrolase [Methylobacillus caricis]MCB5188154.1 MBL fold metallo-hydrolase [Methylobacillus caricis]